MRFARKSERAEQCGNGGASSTLARLKRIGGVQRSRVNADERQHTTNLARCRSWFEERRKLASGVQGTLKRGNSLGNRPPRSQIFEAALHPGTGRR